MFNSTSVNFKAISETEIQFETVQNKKEYKQTTKNQYTEIGIVTEVNGEGVKKVLSLKKVICLIR
jgi:hypothetical protein